jgi:hypothetical protein
MNVSSFLAKLAESPQLAEKFKGDPVSISDQFQLSAADREVLQTKDPEKIAELLKENDSDGPWIIAKWIIKP